MLTASSFLLLCLSITLGYACKFVDIQSGVLGGHRFSPLPQTVSESSGIRSGRTAFATSEGPALFLYHVLAEPALDGVGRWVINDVLGSTSNALAYVDTWAVMPHLVNDVNDIGNDWMAVSEGKWVKDPEFMVFCVYDDEAGDGLDSTIFFESSLESIFTSGFYVETIVDKEESKYEGPLYAQVKAMEADPQLYLYKTGDHWIIGDAASIGTENGMAYVVDSASLAHKIESEEWNFVNNGTWTMEYATIVSATSNTSIYEALREQRAIKYIPTGQRVTYLRNRYVMPLIGLGTGALSPDTAKDTISKALRMGYRSLDLAREYNNEELVGDLFDEFMKTDTTNEEIPLPYRPDVFLISKVWPTHLGFEPTSLEIVRSMEALHTNYIDLYYIHWPSCNAEVEWMHCHTAVDPEANWIESWHALEKAYAEGRVNSIGVSNFDLKLLQHLEEVGTVRPHAVQNFAKIGEMDMDVRRWCLMNNAAYQPYASQRVMSSIPQAAQVVLQRVAASHNVTVQVASLRFFLQTGAAVIPRSGNEVHLKENLGVFDWELTVDEMNELGWALESDEGDA